MIAIGKYNKLSVYSFYLKLQYLLYFLSNHFLRVSIYSVLGNEFNLNLCKGFSRKGAACVGVL